MPPMGSVTAIDGRREWRFPEQWFPCKHECEIEYRKLVALGRKRMLGYTVAFCCLARSLGEVAHLTIERIKSLASAFSDYSVFVIEGDSDDSTPAILEKWAAGDRKITVCSEQLGIRRYPQIRCLERASHMSKIRNKYLALLRQQGLPDYVIVLDTDLKGGWSEDGIASTFGYEDWDAVGSNGLSVRRGECNDGLPMLGLMHFDSWAFRKYGQPEADLPDDVVNNYVFCRGESMVRVFSCFGGLAVYRSEAIGAAFYSGGDCEHVPFYRRMHESGFDRIFLNPSQIVLYSSLADMRFLSGQGDPRISSHIK